MIQNKNCFLKDRRDKEVLLKKEIKEWADRETKKDPDSVKGKRMSYLRTRIEKLEEMKEGIKKCFKVDVLVDFINGELIEILREEKKLHREIDNFEKPCYTDSITDEMIENARNYPIKEIIDVNERGYAICPFHNDTNPSAYCKNNYLHCFSCDETADTIKLYQQLYNTNFPKTINILQ